MQQSKSILPSSLHVLIVEDVPADAELVLLTLETANIATICEVVDTLDACQQLLQEKSWDVVLADFRLKGFNAYKVLELLKQSGQEVPLILVTGSLGEEAAVDCIKAGMTDYVLKDRLFRLPMVLKRSLQEFELKRQQRLATAQIYQQAQRETIVNRIVQAMRKTLVLDEVLQTTVDMVSDALQPSSCLIIRPNATNQMVVCNVNEAASQEWKQLLNQPCEAYSYFAEALHRDELIVVNCTEDLSQLAMQELAAQYRVHAFLTLPLIYQQNFLGGLSLYQCDRERNWTSDEIAMIQAIADQCAIAIHQAQLFSQVQQHAKQERFLNQIGHTLNSSLDPGYILQEIVRLTGECFGVDRALLFAIEAGRIHIKNEWLISQQIPSMTDFNASVAEWFDSPKRTPQDAKTNFVFHAPDYTLLPPTPARLTLVHQKDVLSVLSVPIFIRDQFFGGLEIHTTTVHRRFTQDEIDLLQRIADQAAIALYNAQSYERLEQIIQARTRELEEEKLLSDAANRAKSEFLANMSHELRTPLTGILGFSSVLLKQVFGSLNEKQQQYIEKIAACGEHLLSLINDLLDLSKIEAGREDLILESVDVRELGETCISLIQEQAESKGLQVSMAIAPEVDYCVADRRRLKQILFNLLSNAVKFTETGSVTLAIDYGKKPTSGTPPDHLSTTSCSPILTPHSPFITFNVIDTGIGISPEGLSLLFQPFQQLDGGLDRKYQGTGLGLVLARKLAQLHGGDISVTSELGSGSCFTLHLPKDGQEAGDSRE
ncbi:GAF domain-containing protein [Leptothermofonsia sp. ETS-13]|uniref:GAF domain-containing sensor histidine kinase n=1 Tax=Leptothermofonsia sp. ETS-13 TaxID=3035696 RepID=UPI003BA136F4